MVNGQWARDGSTFKVTFFEGRPTFPAFINPINRINLSTRQLVNWLTD
jgi:hypothetical protein